MSHDCIMHNIVTVLFSFKLYLKFFFPPYVIFLSYTNVAIYEDFIFC